MDRCVKNELSRIENFIVNISREGHCIDFLKNPRDDAWKNKHMDRSNVPKQTEWPDSGVTI